jgi:hypothetical protein
MKGMPANLVAAHREMAEMATVILVAGVISDSRPARTLKAGMTVMLERTRDEPPAIQQLWPRFERLVGLRGRRMYAIVDVRAGTYAACTPAREGDILNASGSIPPPCREAGVCRHGSPESRPGCTSASARPCKHSKRWQRPLTLAALSLSTTGATMRSNCGYPFPRSPDEAGGLRSPPVHYSRHVRMIGR